MYDTLSLRILFYEYRDDIPPTRRELARFINSRIAKVESTINTLKRDKLPTYLPFETYTDYLTDDNFSNIFRSYYMIDNDQYGHIPIINILYSLDQDKFDKVLYDLGLNNFRGTDDDLLTLLNAQVGLPWESMNARDICLIPRERLTNITGMSYIDSLLLYITGYYLGVNDTVTEGSTSRKIIAYTAFRTLPYIRMDNRRPMEHVSSVVSTLDLGKASRFIDSFDFARYMETMYPNEALSKMGIVKENYNYFLNSLKDYSNVSKFTMDTRPILNENLGKTLSEYSDKALLDAVEVDINYVYRDSLIRAVIDEFTTYRWSIGENIEGMKIGRSKFCSEEYSLTLTHGRAMDYYCYDLNTLWAVKSDDELRSEDGLRLNEVHKADPHRYISGSEVETLTLTLLESGHRQDLVEFLNENANYINNVMNGKDSILIIRANDGFLTDEVMSLFRKLQIDLDKFRIDYVTPDLMKLDGEYYTINNNSFGDKISLDILKDSSNLYKYIIYDKYDNKRSIFSPDTLETIHRKLEDSGIFYVNLMTGDEGHINKIGEYFNPTGRLTLSHVKSFFPYRKVKKNIYETYIGDNWQDNWVIVDNAGGGNCMYHAIAEALGEYDNDMLREILINNIPENMLEDMKSDVASDRLIHISLTRDERMAGVNIVDKKARLHRKLMEDLTIDDVISSFLSCNKWGTSRELRILSDALNFIPIVISVEDTEGQLCAGVNYDKVVGKKNLERIIILIQTGQHYQTLKRIDGLGIFKENMIPKKLMQKFRESCLVIKTSGISVA